VWVKPIEVNQIGRFCRRPNGIEWPQPRLGLYSTERLVEIAADIPIISATAETGGFSSEHPNQGLDSPVSLPVRTPA
jgi:hypothetical protein